MLLLDCVTEVGTIDFGSANTGKNRYWCIKLESDFLYRRHVKRRSRFLPIITGLDETGLIHNNIVLTRDEVYKNTHFQLVGKV